jgi:hypothetical protein
MRSNPAIRGVHNIILLSTRCTTIIIAIVPLLPKKGSKIRVRDKVRRLPTKTELERLKLHNHI